ncbi:MAG TPA: cytidylate kinase family protein [Candidatus Polarisedimenticolia bacterium]|nr:cytidylate kinase family protein [Candidatus Polarisedimenticolia bacterium]
MNTTYDRSYSLLTSELGYLKSHEPTSPNFGPSITLSQQTGSGAHDIAEHVAKMMQELEAHDGKEWNVFDRQIVQRALEEHELPAQFEKYMTEDRRSYVDDVMDEFFGLRPPSWVLVPQIVETMLRLLQNGHAIIVGRGAAAAAVRMPGVFHVRLVASLPKRIERIQSVRGLSADQAEKFIRRSDRGAHRYAQAHFHASIEDDLLYHMVINTDRIPYGDAAMLIAKEAHEAFKREALLPAIARH